MSKITFLDTKFIKWALMVLVVALIILASRFMISIFIILIGSVSACLLAAKSLLRIILVKNIIFSTPNTSNDTTDKPPYFPLTILIPARNEQEVIGDCIKSILASDYPSFQLIVIDDASSDNTREVVMKAAAGDPRFQLIRHEKGGIGKHAALNPHLPKTGLIAVYDADSIIGSNCISRLISWFSDDQIAAANGAAFPRMSGAKQAFLWAELEATVNQNATLAPMSAMNLGSGLLGTNMVIRAEILHALGGFRRALLEDVNLALALQCDGWRIVFDPGAVSSVSQPINLTTKLRQQAGWASGFFSEFIGNIPLLIYAPISFLKKSALLLYSTGYLDRFAILLAVISAAISFFMLKSTLWPAFFFGIVILYFLTAAAHIIAAVKSAGWPVSKIISLYKGIHLAIFDLFASITGILTYLFSFKTKRYKSPRTRSEKGEYIVIGDGNASY